MQAVRVERRRPVDTRWLQHLSLLSALGLLFTSIVSGSPGSRAELAERVVSGRAEIEDQTASAREALAAEAEELAQKIAAGILKK